MVLGHLSTDQVLLYASSHLLGLLGELLGRLLLGLSLERISLVLGRLGLLLLLRLLLLGRFSLMSLECLGIRLSDGSKPLVLGHLP